MTIKGSVNNSYQGGSESGIGANSLALTDTNFIKKTAGIVDVVAATETIDGVNYSVDTYASDNQTVDKVLTTYAPTSLDREYTVDIAGQLITFSGALVTGNDIDLKVNGVAMTQVPFNTSDAQTLTDLASQIATDFASVVDSSTSGTNSVDVVGNIPNSGVVITDVVVTGGAGQATAVVSALNILQTDEEDFFDLVNSQLVDGTTKSASTGQVQLIRFKSATESSFKIANA